MQDTIIYANRTTLSLERLIEQEQKWQAEKKKELDRLETLRRFNFRYQELLLLLQRSIDRLDNLMEIKNSTTKYTVK